MADFARWGVAVGRGLGWQPNDFLSAYEKNRIAATDQSLDGSPLGSLLVKLAGRSRDFERSPTELLEMLTESATEHKDGKLVGWPKTAQALTNELRRIAPQLRMRGVRVIFKRTHRGRRVCIVTGRYRQCSEATVEPSHPEKSESG